MRLYVAIAKWAVLKHIYCAMRHMMRPVWKTFSDLTLVYLDVLDSELHEPAEMFDIEKLIWKRISRQTGNLHSKAWSNEPRNPASASRLYYLKSLGSLTLHAS